MFSVLFSAFAQDAAATAEPSALAGIMPLVLIFVVFYFLLIRPQQKKFKEHQTMLGALRRGDKVITSGGIIGTIHKIENDEDAILLEIAEGVRVKAVRSMIASVVNRSGNAETNDNSKGA